MTKRQLVDAVSRKAHMPKRAASEAIDVFLEEIGRTLSKREKVVLSGFGTFAVKRMRGKTVKNPKKDEFHTIKDHWLPRFTPGKRLKERVS